MHVTVAHHTLLQALPVLQRQQSNPTAVPHPHRQLASLENSLPPADADSLTEGEDLSQVPDDGDFPVLDSQWMVDTQQVPLSSVVSCHISCTSQQSWPTVTSRDVHENRVTPVKFTALCRK